jgi:hypothetical protein
MIVSGVSLDVKPSPKKQNSENRIRTFFEQ